MIKEEFAWIKPFIDKYIDLSDGKDNVPKDYVTTVFNFKYGPVKVLGEVKEYLLYRVVA